jgi:hypothetical protein
MVNAWHQNVATAESDKELLAITQEYMGQWKATELRSLPKECRPDIVTSIQDIYVVRDQLGEEPCSGKVHQDLVTFFMKAVDRIFELHGARPMTANEFQHGIHADQPLKEFLKARKHPALRPGS